MDFGAQIKKWRLEKQLTKEALCGDESELSVRQLTRIEANQCNPSLSKATFIARQLGVSISDLAGEAQLTLSERYKELKYLLLHTQTFRDPERLAQREAYFDEIFTDFYDDLPEEEQLIIEVLQSHLHIFTDKLNYAANKILEDYLQQAMRKTRYHVNELILLDLYFNYSCHYQENYLTNPALENHEIITRLIEAIKLVPMENLFLVNKVLIAACGVSASDITKPYVPLIITTLEESLRVGLDFQRLPILNIIKWKHALYALNEEKTAETYFNDAKTFAILTKDYCLVEKLTSEWLSDRKIFDTEFDL